MSVEPSTPSPSRRTAAPASFGQRLHRAVASRGVFGTVTVAARRAAAPVVDAGTLVVFARDLDELPPAPDPRGDWTPREAAPWELDAVLEASEPGHSAEALRDRFRRGHRCFVAADGDGRIGHTRWVTSEPPYVSEIRRHLLLAPGDAYFYDGFTHPDARRRGLDGATRCAIFRALRQRGFRRAVSYVRADNPAGLRAAGRWQRPVGRVRYLRLGPRRNVLFGERTIAPLAFSAHVTLDDAAAVPERVVRWREWFQGWLEQPLEHRSTGFSAVPDAYFTAMGDLITGLLELDPGEDAVLDLGCASGGVTRKVAPRVREIAGADATVGLLRGAAGLGIRSAAGRPMVLAAADGRRLPWPDGTFDKVYCVGVIHTLPGLDDGFRVAREAIRVCRPGGRVLIGAVPDRRRRWSARRQIWRRGDWRERGRLVAATLLPAPIRPPLQRFLRVAPTHRLIALEHDLERLARRVREVHPEVECRVAPFPRDFWSRDFRASRSNLLIGLPPEPG
ncbi:MAG: methyltransferase domain-containing protein [Thermoanaerobaculia bacterium]